MDSKHIAAFTPTPPPTREAVFVSDGVLDRLARVSSGSLTTQLFKKGFRQPVLTGLRPLQSPVKSFAGRAYTMRFIPAREDIDTPATLTTAPHADNLQWVGVEQVAPGEVLVIDSRRDAAAASMGGMLVTRLLQRGARAVVTDGAFRDGSELARLDLPTWCAGVAVYPGDVIHGDADNLSVVPAHLAAELADLCEAQDALEAYLALRVQRGEALWGLYPPSAATRQQHQDWLAAGRPAL